MAKLTSHRALAFLATLATIFALSIMLVWPSNLTRRTGDFTRVANALAAYKLAHGQYPLQGKASLVIGLDPAASEFSILVPKLLAHLPRDPRNLSDPNRQYLYFSNGSDYKFIVHAPENMGRVASEQPALIDPKRPTFAYGIWTSGGAGW